MRTEFHHYPVGRIVVFVIFLCIVTWLILPFTTGDGQARSVGVETNLERETEKSIDGDSQRFLPRIDPHRDLLNILRRNGRDGLTQPPNSRSGNGRGPSEPTEALQESSLQNREPTEDRDRFDDPGAAAEYYRLTRLPTGATELPMERYQEALVHMAQMRRYSTASNQLVPSRKEAGQDMPEASLGTWSSLGPGNIGGRTRAIVIDPTNPNSMFAAAVTGGVWKTINAGASWFPTSDLIANLNVSTLAMDPANPATLYAGTGEELPGWPGNGLFKTTNGGASWTQLTATANNSSFFYVKRVVVSPSSGQRVYAATNSGVWRSIDGGTSWTQVLTLNISGGCTDLAIRTDTTGKVSDYIFAACGLSDQATIYRNTNANGAGTWDAVLTEANMGRTSLALAPSNQNTIYALSADLTGPYGRGSLHAVFRSTTGGGSGSWTARVRNTDPNKMNTLLLSYCDGSGSQGFYDQAIAVDPVNENRIWVGGINLFRSDDGGANWASNLSAVLHLDQHAIVFHPQYDGVNNKTMLVGNDGGIFATADATTGPLKTTPCDFTSCPGCVTFTSLNHSYVSAQFYHGLPYPDGTTYFGGTQDNAVIRGSDVTGLNGWSTLPSPLGDGQFVAVDPTNTNTIYANGGVNSIFKSTNGGTSWVSATTGISDSSFFITPLVMDPTNSQRLWTGGSSMWRTANGATNWSQASAALTGGGIATAIVVSPLSADKVLAGTSTGFIHRTTAGTTSTSSTTWSSVQPRTGRVSWLAYDPSNSNVAYATYSTFNSLGSDRHVYKSIDGGATWAGIDGTAPNNLPDVPTHTIAVDPTNPQRLYVGTDVGVFSSLDGGANWAVENTGFANVITEALSFNTGSLSTKYLFAFTHGRGAWRVAAPTASPSPVVQLSSATYSAAENIGSTIVTVNRTGDTSGTATVDYATSDTAGSNCGTLNTGKASSRCDYETTLGTLKFAAGETSKTISIPIIDDTYAEGNESFTVTLSNATGATLGSPSAATVTIIDNETTNGVNPLDDARYYVRVHYLDFLNREPDSSGWDFWTNQITVCGSDPQCIEVRRINVSASFFLSIEFQQTGYLVERIYKASFGDGDGSSTFPSAHQLKVPIVRFNEFLADTQQIQQGVIVGQGNWQQQLDVNKAAFALGFVQRSRFSAALLTSMTPANFVDQLFMNAGVTPSATDRTTAVNEFGGAADTSNVTARSKALRDVAENATLTNNEFNRAFVLMQYFGYLRRNPNDPQDSDYTGYDFWLTKLNQFNGNYINAEMVKAFISSIEYRQRFGP